MGKQKRPLPPPIGTRTQNKEAHPAVKAGVTARPRRSGEQVEAERIRKSQEKRQREEEEDRSRSHAAEIEDQLRQEDIQRELTANHPPTGTTEVFRPYSLRGEKSDQAVIRTSHLEEDEASDGVDEFKPSSGPESEDDEEEEDGLEEELVKRYRKRKPSCKDITALRKTDIALGQQKSNEEEPPTKKQKSSSSKRKTAFVQGWKPGARQMGLNPTSNGIDSDAMAQLGGFVRDDEDDEVEQVAVRSSGPEVRGRKKLPSMVKVTDTPRTQKEIRGGEKKWNLKHLPSVELRDKFSNIAVALAKQKAGTLKPWAGLSVRDVQDIIDTVFGEDKYVVSSGDVWTGLCAYRLNDWRAGFIISARGLVKSFFEGNAHSFPNKKSIRRAVKFYTKWHGKDLMRTAACHWQRWTSKKDKQNKLIIETFAHAHLANITKLPEATDPIDTLPVGPQVEHALKEYRTGERVIVKNYQGHFSAENYGDKSKTETGPDGHSRNVYKPWASRYMTTIRKFDTQTWEDILTTAKEALDAAPPRRGRKSRSSSLDNSISSSVDIEDIIFESDAPDNSSGSESDASTSTSESGTSDSSSGSSDGD
ncbi:hypothetical protein H0H92_004154 [Tricholoma furcatifolium]|nr:hypothetical protein H0H92_004154 [Tricholoma furcatifolium]